jgi:peptidoglycan/LPS O-acetylase OafA/YrhL
MQDPTLWYQALGFLTGFAYQAVVVFFLLSGWLVGGSFLNKLHEPGAMTSYAVDRMTRLWIVMIPAFVLTLVIGAYTGAIDPGTFSYAVANEYSAASFLGNLFGLQDVVLPRFGGNFPLWSLANETWYYVLFPLLVISFTGRSTFSRVAPAAVCLLVTMNLTGSIVLYFSLWLLGAAFADRDHRLCCAALDRSLPAVYCRGLSAAQGDQADQ